MPFSTIDPDKLLDELPEALFMEDLEGHILSVNDQACQLLGYKKEELLNMCVHDLVPNGEPAFLPDQIDHATQEGEPLETINLHKDGTKVPIELQGRIIEIKGEERILVSIRNITKRKQAEEKLHTERERLKQLHNAVDRFQSCETENELYNTTLEVTEKVLGFDISLIYVLRDEKLTPVAATKLNESDLPVYGKDEALAGKTLTEGKTIWGDDLREIEAANPEDPGLRAFMSVPIGDLGVFQASSKKINQFSEGDIELAEILAGHLNEEIKRIRLEEKLRQQAIHDPLTGVYNRRYFNETLNKEIEQANRYDKPLAFIMMDINRFKEINDRYSHQIGDKVLEEIAKLLKENVRSADTVVRYGGDEFLIMMPETNSESKNLVTRLKEKLTRWNEHSDLLDFPLTLAIGAAHWSPNQGRDVEETLKEADQKMYKDKRKRD